MHITDLAHQWRDPERWRDRGGWWQCQLLAGWPHGFGGCRSYPRLPEVLAVQWWQEQGRSGQSATWVHQVHGDCVLRVENRDPESRADALVTTTPGQSVWVSTADCVPILMASRAGVVAIHAGWRGTAAQIAVKALAALDTDLGVTPEEVTVAIGPCISGPVYQVSQEVADQVLATLPTDHSATVVLPDPLPDKVRLDLGLTNALQLLNAGIPSAKITIHPLCTWHNAEVLFSYRRLGSLKVGDAPPWVQWSGIALPES
ncbi:MAG: peptidoglycan editing factor PgeF [Synechococcales cyanobacterium]